MFFMFLMLEFTCALLIFRYEDFFGSKNKMVAKRKSKLIDGSDEAVGLGDERDDEAVGEVVYYV